MANEIEVTAGSGLTLYAIVRNPANRQVWNTTLNAGAGGFEAYVAANWPQYAIPLVEQDVTGDYAANFPTAIPAAAVPYSVDVRQRAGGTANPSPSVDARVTAFPVPWTGAAEASSAAMQPRLLTALPTAAAAAAGGLPTVNANNQVAGVASPVVTDVDATVTSILAQISASPSAVAIATAVMNALNTAQPLSYLPTPNSPMDHIWAAGRLLLGQHTITNAPVGGGVWATYLLQDGSTTFAVIKSPRQVGVALQVGDTITISRS